MMELENKKVYGYDRCHNISQNSHTIRDGNGMSYVG